MRRIRFRLDMAADDEEALCRQLRDLANVIAAGGLPKFSIGTDYHYRVNEMRDSPPDEDDAD